LLYRPDEDLNGTIREIAYDERHGLDDPIVIRLGGIAEN
jgi:hypothetical protein